MKIIQGFMISTMVLFFSACASVNVPGSNLIDTIPVVKMGDTKPEGKNYILFIPAKTEFPVHFTLKGNLITMPVDQELITSINKDIYVYKYWSSFDGRKWLPSHDIIKTPIGIGVGPEGGHVHLKVDLAEK